jgi:hypothetical protein
MLKRLAAHAAGAVVFVGLLASGSTAAAEPDGLLGPGSTPPSEVVLPPRSASPVTPAAMVRGFGWSADDTHGTSGPKPVGQPYAVKTDLDHSSGTLADAASIVVRQATGTYRVTLRGINGEGVPQVTAGIEPNRCRVLGWKPKGPDQDITLVCHNRAGQPVDSTYMVSFSNLKTTKYPNARLWFNGSSVPAAHSYNSAGGINAVSRGSSGVYRVVLRKLGSQAGNVQVTATGAGATWCKVSSWGSATTDQVVTVRCFAPNGTPANSAFLLSFAQAGNTLGAPNVQAGLGLRSMYASVDPTKSQTVHLVRRYNTPSGGSWSTTVLPEKIVSVSTPTAIIKDKSSGHVQVTALGGAAVSCHVRTWDAQQAYIQCVNAAGTPVLSPFALTVFSEQLR